MIFIKNGIINTITNGIIKGDILIEYKKIKALGENWEVPQDAKIIDAEGKLVFPGFIDAHTHLGLVDIGIKNDGLVHKSEMSKGFVKDPMTIVTVGDIVDVKVIGVDMNKKRVALSMKM